jgi:hypothetical protein
MAFAILNFDRLIADVGDMADPDRFGAENGNWSSFDFMSLEPSTLSYLISQFHFFHLLV